MEYGCVLNILAKSSAFPFARTLTIQVSLVCPQPYFLAICLSGNNCLNRGPAWYDAKNVFNFEVNEKDICIYDANIYFS